MTGAGKRPVQHLICDLPGSGKTTLGKRLGQAGHGMRFSSDEWFHRLGVDFYDEAGRGRVEVLQWAAMFEAPTDGKLGR